MQSSVEMLMASSGVVALATTNNSARNLSMPGDPHYQPNELRSFLGYDQRVGWQVIVEWCWLVTLANAKVMPPEHGKLLQPELLRRLLDNITTTQVTSVERQVTKHDILALCQEMRSILPVELHRWLHFGLTSYDTICSAYALCVRETFRHVFVPELAALSTLWQERIKESASITQAGRTHLQTATPVTVGCWLAQLHQRFVRCARKADTLVSEIPGKASGAVGTSAALNVLVPGVDLEHDFLALLGLPWAVSTQITPVEPHIRFYGELCNLSGVLANFGDDVRHLQASAIGELQSPSSTSSTMSHKTANPIAAENVDGMHASVLGEYTKVLLTSGSTLQRDLRWSNVMRGFGALMVFTFQQIKTTTRILQNLTVDEARLSQNMKEHGRLVVAELLHLYLQGAGVVDAHSVVNKVVVPSAAKSGRNLAEEMDALVKEDEIPAATKCIWNEVPDEIRTVLEHPESYTGNAVRLAEYAAAPKHGYNL